MPAVVASINSLPLAAPWSFLSESRALLPEIILVVTMCTALILPVIPQLRPMCRRSHTPMLLTAVAGLLAATLAALVILTGSFGQAVPQHHLLGGMIAVDQFALTIKVILYLFTIFVLYLWTTTTRDQVRVIDGPDYVTLILGGVLGMSLMVSASNFVMIFLAIEAASFPSYALAGFYKTSRRGSEASLKYVLFGAVTSAIMLYGLSMLYGSYGTLDLAAIAEMASAEWAAAGAEGGGSGGMSVGLLLGLFGFMIGVGFKLSAVPTHFWCPDVFEGAPFEITVFLSVASKAAAIALLLRVMLTIGFFAGPEAHGALTGIATLVGLVGLITATWGNLTAYYQDNVKRFLAYSSIAHAGYMIMAAGLLTATMRGPTTGPSQGHDLAYAILFYIIVYSFMNYGAFTIAAVIARSTGSESLRDYAGLASRNPMLALAFGICLMSLFGMPLTGGFWAKIKLGFEMWNQQMWWLVVGLVINTVFSLYFYLKPIIIMVFMQPEGRRPVVLGPAQAVLITVAVVGVMATGIIPDQVTSWARNNAVLVYHGTPAADRLSADGIAAADDLSMIGQSIADGIPNNDGMDGSEAGGSASK